MRGLGVSFISVRQAKMKFEEIIESNKQISYKPWWVRYAYHFTDVSNAVSILQSGKLFSRLNASDYMKNDNASSHVLDFTKRETQSFVRFYFRPLTPTQYYNEGYKHKDLRYDGDVNANITIPVFFVFDLKKILEDPKTKFSNFSQAGSGATLYSGVEDFANKMEFEKIYSYGMDKNTFRKYRHAEILYPNEYAINNSLEYIVCRNEVEKNTLLNLILSSDQRAYYTYKDKIVISKGNMFECNGLFLENIGFVNNSFSATYAHTYSKDIYDKKMLTRNKISKLENIEVLVKFQWKNLTRIIDEKTIRYVIDYLKPPRLICKNLPEIKDAKKLRVSIFTQEKLAGVAEFFVDDTEILK